MESKEEGSGIPVEGGAAGYVQKKNDKQYLDWCRIYSIMKPPLAEIPMLASPESDPGRLYRGLSSHDLKGQSCVRASSHKHYTQQLLQLAKAG